MFSQDNLHNIEYLAIKEVVMVDILIKKCDPKDIEIIKILEDKKMPFENILEKVRKM